MDQQHIVLTVDEALYLKLVELKWLVEEYRDMLIPCLSGLHISMNYLGVIGRHVSHSGLNELWVECDILGANDAQNVMGGKGYARAIMIHKLTLQAVWQLLLPRLNAFLRGIDLTLRADLLDLSTVIDADHIAHMVEKLTSDRFQQAMKDLIADDPTVEFWWSYMTKVSILLCLTRAQCDGLWDMHLYAFKWMLPFFFWYDHINYARWGSVYLAEMSYLPQEVLHDFQEGNFVVKRTDRQFNQVFADQSTEWLNATGKKSWGLIGITRISSAINRWALSFKLSNVIISQTATTMGRTPDGKEDVYTHSEDWNGARWLWCRQDSCFIETTWRISRWSWHIEEHNEQWFSHPRDLGFSPRCRIARTWTNEGLFSQTPVWAPRWPALESEITNS